MADGAYCLLASVDAFVDSGERGIMTLEVSIPSITSRSLILYADYSCRILAITVGLAKRPLSQLPEEKQRKADTIRICFMAVALASGASLCLYQP